MLPLATLLHCDVPKTDLFNLPTGKSSLMVMGCSAPLLPSNRPLAPLNKHFLSEVNPSFPKFHFYTFFFLFYTFNSIIVPNIIYITIIYIG